MNPQGAPDGRPPGPPGRKGPFFAVALFVLIGALGVTWLNSESSVLKRVPTSWLHLASALLVLLVGISASRLLERHVFRLSVDRLNPQSATALRYLTRLLLYVAIVLSGLAALGVGLSSLVFGGAFLTVIIGLAGQTVFSNIIAGIWLVVFHPFKVGDNISLVTWQFSQMPPTFPHEVLRPTYSGTVRDINLMYTVIQSGEGYLQVIPNGIIAQALIENRSLARVRNVRIRFDVSYDYDAEELTERLRNELSNHFSGSAAPYVVVADLYPTAYSLAVTVQSDLAEELLRDRVLGLAMRAMRAMGRPAESRP